MKKILSIKSNENTGGKDRSKQLDKEVAVGPYTITDYERNKYEFRLIYNTLNMAHQLPHFYKYDNSDKDLFLNLMILGKKGPIGMNTLTQLYKFCHDKTFQIDEKTKEVLVQNKLCVICSDNTIVIPQIIRSNILPKKNKQSEAPFMKIEESSELGMYIITSGKKIYPNLDKGEKEHQQKITDILDKLEKHEKARVLRFWLFPSLK